MKLQGFLMLSDEEISGFGRVVDHGNGDFFVDDIFVIPQKGNAGETVIEPEDVAELVTRLIEDGEDPGAIKLWWHSHASGGIFFSSTDIQTMRNLTQNFMFGLVGNNRGEVRGRLDLAEPFPLSIDDIPVVYLVASQEVLAWCQAEIDQKVAPIPVVVVRRRGKRRQQVLLGEGDEIDEALIASGKKGNGRQGPRHITSFRRRPAFRMPEDMDSEGQWNDGLVEIDSGSSS